MCMHVQCIYIYTYEGLFILICMYIYIYMHIYIYTKNTLVLKALLMCADLPSRPVVKTFLSLED